MLLHRQLRHFRYSSREYLANAQLLLTSNRHKTKTLQYSRVTTSDNDKRFELHLRGAPLNPANPSNPGFLTEQEKLDVI